jgi:hypothetical protein
LEGEIVKAADDPKMEFSQLGYSEAFERSPAPWHELKKTLKTERLAGCG